MCAIAGIATWKTTADLSPVIDAMTSTMARRGPDGAGIWTDEAGGVGFGHRRLAILDASHGHQPMVSPSGRFIITYNGTIYNYLDIRRELETGGFNSVWRGHSDTEVLLAAVERWGVEQALQRANGMFAFALWDRQKRVLTLARDRIGEKPLYYMPAERRFIFASSLDAIRMACRNNLELDREAVAELVDNGYIAAPRTIFRGVFKLKPGHMLVLENAGQTPEPRCYWSLEQPESGALGHHNNRTDQAVVDQARSLIGDAVQLQTVSDVPIGAWLSGGVDSSIVVAALQEKNNRQVRTFTLGFDRPDFDEAPHARAVAAHLGTDHTEVYVGAADARNIIPALPQIYDEPFADSSQIPTSLLAAITSQRVTVALSGDGGDELFGGYPRYNTVAALWKVMRYLPVPLRRAAGRMLQGPDEKSWDRMLPSAMHAVLNGGRIHRLGQVLASAEIGEMYAKSLGRIHRWDGIVLGAQATPLRPWPRGRSELDSMRRMDLQRYLPDDLLVKTDRASMAVGLECRSPLLDRRLVDFAFGLPDRMLIRRGVRKWLLRRVLLQYVPGSLIGRPKRGFSIPIAEWLRGPLREWAGDLLAPARLDRAGVFKTSDVTTAWQGHLSGRADRSAFLWSILMFQAWQGRVFSEPPSRGV